MPLYPEIEPYNKFNLRVSNVHTLYVEECGNKGGAPIVFLHGGPGGGCSPSDRRFFDPNVYRIVLFDQRGSGKSTPTATLEENDTWKLVEDIEAIRTHLRIDKWVVFGGSWGSTLSLAYAITHPAKVKALVLRGIFLVRTDELQWLYQKGASHIFPDYWSEYLETIPKDERIDMIAAYYKRLTSSNENERLSAAKAWSKWECAISKLIPSEEKIAQASKDTWSLAFARIECHYFVNKGFFKSDSYILDNVDKIRHIPCIVAQGRYDMVCPMVSAWELCEKWPEAKLYILDSSGHSATEDQIAKVLVQACDEFKTL